MTDYKTRFEDELIKTKIPDSHKPWSGHIQGKYYYVGSPEQPGGTVPEGPLHPDFRLRGMPCAGEFEPGRPLGVKPYPPYRRPLGTESSAPPFYDHGYEYPPEEFYGVEEVDPGIDPKRVEGNVAEDLGKQITPSAWSPDWLDNFGAPGFQFDTGPVSAPRPTVLGIPPMVPRPNVPFWGDVVEYGVTKVIDTIIQDNPGSPWPERPEELAYMPEGVIGPYGISIPTISKRKD